jgi:hypothetical protein
MVRQPYRNKQFTKEQRQNLLQARFSMFAVPFAQ